MNEEDKKRFARYYPGYVEPQINDEDNLDNENTNENTNENKKNVLGYIAKIDIDKDKLINDTITNYKNNA